MPTSDKSRFTLNDAELETFCKRVEKIRAEDGLSIATIAKRFGISASSVNSRMTRWKKLREAREHEARAEREARIAREDAANAEEQARGRVVSWEMSRQERMDALDKLSAESEKLGLYDAEFTAGD